MTTTIAAPDRAPVREAVPATSRWWYVVLAGGLIGIVGTSWQTVERIAYAGGGGESFCDISSVLSCSSVYSHWQSSALGIPNSLVGLPVFAFLASAAVSALLGSRLSPVFVRSALGISLFMTAFVVWYLQQTAMEIGALCLFCLACMVSLTLTSSGLVRVADAEGALGSGRVATRVRTWVDSWVDLAAWAGLAMLVAAMLVLGLAV